jgi:hypothetical protein
MSALHDTPVLAGARLHYDVERVEGVVQLERLEPLGNVDV